ncbi:ABC transporter ATP-binding protein [Janibacter sp. G56]|uniref:ABC transporter ATP-binding protein n=1 Tax=Janibacter sp. G56 TaxID=3418717 RepID=UPI003D063FA0
MTTPLPRSRPAAAIAFDRVTITYSDQATPALRDVTFELEEGELALVVGRTGSGKSTLLGAINGHVPHFTGGTLAGSVRVHGRDTSTHRPRDLADLVGVVGQDPLAGFVTDTVEEELAYGMEQLGLGAATMRKRVEEALDVLGIADLRRAALAELSGGQQQRVAIGAVLTTHPRVIVLDEPTSALDPTGAEEVLASITRLAHDLAVTIVVAEHRIERVLQYADSVLHVADGHVTHADPATAMVTASVAPPVVELGRWAQWSPLPLSVRDARRRAHDLRDRLADGEQASSHRAAAEETVEDARVATPGEAALSARGVVVTYGDLPAVAGVDLSVPDGQVVALMGRNGCGKSTLLWALQGSGPRDAGEVTVPAPRAPEPRTARQTGDAARVDPAALSAADRRRLVGMVPQTASDLLYLETVADECAQADTESRATAGTCAALLDRIAPGIPPARHPRDLSVGQQLALVLAVQLTAGPRLLLLDEPTRGLDYGAKAALRDVLRDLAAAGRSVIVATHDVEFVAEAVDRVVVMASGEVVADGPTAEVVVSSPAFAPQVAKITAPGPWLTVDHVVAALGRGAP